MAAFNPRTADLDQLAGWIGDATIDSVNYNKGMAEIVRRQTKAQLDSCAAQVKASNAEVKAAEAATLGAAATEKNAKYMLASVIVAALAAIGSAVYAIATVHPFK